jgi:phosphatidylserine/phosphatidylglycerophosphate/cardiolipin synthase-like enzyme
MLYFQNQYIAIGKQIPRAFSDLIDALLAKAEELKDGFRMILRDIGDTRPMLDVLEGLGFDVVNRVKVQKATHTKGIIVDGRRVLVGSHNWSGPGTTRNRDASLLFDDEQIAGYFQKVFLHDWTYLATTRVSGEIQMPRAVGDGSRVAPSAPEGYVAIPWESYYED